MSNGRNTTGNGKYVTIGAAAQLLGLSIDTLRRWERAGRLSSERLDGKNRYFKVADLKAFAYAQKLSTGDVAKLLKVSEATVRRLEATGMLQAERSDSGKRFFDAEQVKQFSKLSPEERQISQPTSKPLQDTPVYEPVAQKNTYIEPRQQLEKLSNIPMQQIQRPDIAPTKRPIGVAPVSVSEPIVEVAKQSSASALRQRSEALSTVKSIQRSIPVYDAPHTKKRLTVKKPSQQQYSGALKMAVTVLAKFVTVILWLLKAIFKLPLGMRRLSTNHYKANQDIYKGIFALVAMVAIIVWLVFSN